MIMGTDKRDNKVINCVTNEVAALGDFFLALRNKVWVFIVVSLD